MRERRLHGHDFAYGRDDGHFVHSLAPFCLVGSFGFEPESFQRIAPETVQPLAQFHQSFTPQRVDPPHRLVMLWQVNAQWKPDLSMKSEVDVRFISEGPEATRVELVHHRFETMGAEAGASMRKDVDGGWPGLIERFVREAEGRN